MSDRVRGMDASSVQGLIDWERVRTAGLELKFIILKLVEGNRPGIDPSFEKNVKAALANGIEPFAYCFAYPLPDDGVNANRSPEDQARLFVEAVSRYPELAKRPLFIDLEWPPPNEWAKWKVNARFVNDWCRRLSAEVHRLTGVAPILYTYPWWWAEVCKGADDGGAWASAYALWMASYNTQGKWPLPSQNPVIPFPWKTWLFWQFDGDGGLRLPTGQDADFCLFNGSLDDLFELAGFSPARAA